MSSGGLNISAVVASALVGMSAIAAPIPSDVPATSPVPISYPVEAATPASPLVTGEAALALPPAPATESTLIPTAESAGPVIEGGRVVLALAVVLVLALAVRAVVRRSVPSLGRSAGVLEVLARQPLGRGHALLVLRMFRRIVLVHHAGSTVTALSEITDADEVAAVLRELAAEVPSHDAAGAASFADVMRRVAASTDAAPDDDDAVEIVDLTRVHAKGTGRGGRRGWWGRPQ